MLSSTSILSGNITTAGAAYTNGILRNVPLTGGTGTGATASTVAGAVVTAVNIVNGGQGYTQLVMFSARLLLILEELEQDLDIAAKVRLQ
jgi:hypothetical protein